MKDDGPAVARTPVGPAESTNGPIGALRQSDEADEVASPRLKAESPAWGSLPALSVAGALGLVIVALADDAARGDRAGADLLLWIGLGLIVVPVAARLATANASREERVGLVGLLGLELYLVKVLNSPLAFTLHDEFSHWRTVDDILRSGHLFHENPHLPVSAFYPGLENAVSALVTTGGLGIFGSAIILLGAARLALVLALYLLYEEAGASKRLAGMAALLYMANPSFIFFDAQFSYESLSLTFAALALLLAARSLRREVSLGPGLVLAIVLSLGATIVTHHLTGFLLPIFLIGWTIAAAYVNRGRGGGRSPAWIALASLVLVLAWTSQVETVIVNYLGPVLERGPVALFKVLTGASLPRALFVDYAGQASPWGDRLLGFGSVALILVGLAYGLPRVWQRYRGNALALALAATAIPYPLSLALRLTDQGAETSLRASEFLFFGIGFVLAVGAEELWLSRPASPPRLAAFAAGATFLVAGGLVVGVGPWARLPGPYLVAADSRSIEPEGVAAADWMRLYLGPDNRVAADRTNGMLVVSYGEQRLTTGLLDPLAVWNLFFFPRLEDYDRTILRQDDIRYLVIDRRLSTALPHVGTYVEYGEQDTFRHTRPIDPAALAKYDGMPRVSRVLDSGDIAVYDVGALANAP